MRDHSKEKEKEQKDHSKKEKGKACKTLQSKYSYIDAC